MKRCLAVLLSTMLLMTSVPMVSATYNDDQFDWGEYACPHAHTEEVAEIPSTCIQQGLSGYIRCVDCRLLLSGTNEALPLADHTYDHICDADCNVCGAVRDAAHSYIETVVRPDCVNGGYTLFTCSGCDDAYIIDEVPATGHDYRADVTTPDCENSGYTVHTCATCGDTYVDNRVDALGHDYRVTEDVLPTCVADGKKVYTCSRCGDSYTEVIPAHGQHTYAYMCDEKCDVCGYVRKDAHAYTFMGTVEPTCGEDGSDGYKCWECGKYWYVTIPATGNHTYSGVCDTACNVCDQVRDSADAHTYMLTEDVAVTCTTDGKQVYTCQGCGDSYTETIAATGHKYTIVITAPTCEQGGYTTHTCTACGDVRVDNRTDALGHNHKLTEEVAPTCTQDGKEVYTCTNCSDSYTVPVPATGHDYRSTVTTPDCENSGYTVHTCATCGDTYVDNRVDALGHNYQVSENVYPTCVTAGKKVYTCTACGDSYTEVVSATGQHTYEYICDETCDVCGYVREDAHAYTFMGTVEPTCGEDGSDGYKCWECGKYRYVTIPATGNHTYSGVCDADCNKCGFIRDAVTAHDYALTEDVAVTCTTDGKQVYTCQGCGDSYTETIAATGHKYTIVITAPTCQQGGYTTHTCTVCGDVRVDNRTDALGHNHKLTEEVAPTCTQDGKEVYTCTNCGDSYDEQIPAAGHKAMKIEGYPATCEKDGLTAGLVCSVCDYVRTEQRVIPALGHSYDDDADMDCNTCGAVREVVVRGDANGDGRVNNRDLGMLQMHLNDMPTTIDVKAVDMDGNGRVNNRDLGLLQKQLNQ